MEQRGEEQRGGSSASHSCAPLQQDVRDQRRRAAEGGAAGKEPAALLTASPAPLRAPGSPCASESFACTSSQRRKTTGRSSSLSTSCVFMLGSRIKQPLLPRRCAAAPAVQGPEPVAEGQTVQHRKRGKEAKPATRESRRETSTQGRARGRDKYRNRARAFALGSGSRRGAAGRSRSACLRKASSAENFVPWAGRSKTDRVF